MFVVIVPAATAQVVVEEGRETTPGMVAGGPVRLTVTSDGPDVRWILPGPRRLDPDVFGTPDMPLGFEEGVGVPLDARLVSTDGTRYTTTAGPTPFSDRYAEVTGRFELEVTDATLNDEVESMDRAGFSATFSGPDGLERSVTLLYLVPVGPDHPFFGGVATNVIMHGGTGIGSKLMPRVPTYITFWGVAELSVDDSLVTSNRLVHGMLTADVRDEDYQLVFDEGVDHDDMHFHLLLPDVEVTPDGPVESPLPSGYVMENGRVQPFIHLLFEDVAVVSGRA